MMLTPEQLEGLRFALEATVHAPGLSVEAAHDLFNHIDAQQARISELEQDAARYRHLRRGQQWSVIDGIGDALRADDLDAAIDAAMQNGGSQ